MKSWIRKQFDNIRLQGKFFSILLLALLLVFVGTLLTRPISDRAYNDALYERTVQLLTVFSQNVQTELNNVADVSFTIIADNVLQNSLTKMRQNAYGTEEWIEARREASDRLLNMSLLHSNVVSILLRSLEGTDISRVIPGQGIPASIFKQQAEAAHAAHGREIWVPNTEETGSIFLVRDVREIADLTLNSIGMLAVRVNMDKIISRCLQPLASMGMPLSCAVDLNGTRIYASQEQTMGLELEEGNFSLRKIDGETMFCVRYSPANSAWSYLAVLPYDGITQSIRWASGISMAVAVAALALALVLGALLTASILRHFHRLLDKYDAFAQGRFQPLGQKDPYQERRDEIGELHRHFDQMASEHQRMIDDIYVKQQLLLEAQLRQLRTQIQPHFLYNTLESIYCLAEKGGDERIATMTAALGRMLRAALNDKRDMITIQEDMRISQEYLNIQLIRYGDQLRADFAIDSAFFPLLIPAMTIQPLVENAIRHGAEEMLEMCEIRVYCERQGQFIDLTVEDNGPGMDENILEKLENGEIKPEGLGIGLSNIHKRLQLAFRSEECGLRIRRENGKTKVIVRILSEEKEEKDDQALVGGR